MCLLLHHCCNICVTCLLFVLHICLPNFQGRRRDRMGALLFRTVQPGRRTSCLQQPIQSHPRSRALTRRWSLQVHGALNTRTFWTWLLLPSLASKTQRTWLRFLPASTEKLKVECIPWPRSGMKDILAEEYKPIFKAYKANPENHALPDGYHADSVWSRELLRKLLQGEDIPKTITIVASLVRTSWRFSRPHVFFLQQKLQ